MQIGQRIKTIRKRLRLSQKELAENLGVSAGAVSTYELGDAYPSIETLAKIARLGGETFNWLIMGEQLRSDGEEITELEKYLLEQFRAATEEGQELIVRVAEMAAKERRGR